jgi:hypothetical protein
VSSSRLYTVNEAIEALDLLDGQTIRVSGVLDLEFEGNSLWHFPKAERKPDYGSSLWASFDLGLPGLLPARLREFDGRRVVVSARVERVNSGHMGLWPGALLIQSVDKCEG